ncbi:MAG: hypothetical protein ACI8RD_014388, partial [Bacillariaceae sp.]|jgi:hypothetical protein
VIENITREDRSIYTEETNIDWEAQQKVKSQKALSSRESTMNKFLLEMVNLCLL